MGKIKLLVMDVDGTLTDGKIYMGQEGESVKAFDIKDGAGIVLLLPQYDIVPVIITARKSQILENRCKELKIAEIHQDCFYKLAKLQDIVKRYDVGLDAVAYVGDDIPDIPCMEEIKKAGGIVMCPSDAISEIKVFADYISKKKAGEGAIRDCIHYLGKRNQEDDIEQRIRKVIDMIVCRQYEEKPEGILSDGSRYIIREYLTKEESECVIETHRRHIDIQYMIEGHEELKLYLSSCLTAMGEYNTEKDVEFWQNGIVSNCSILVPGSFAVIMNNQPYKEAISHRKSEKIKKLVCKIEV